MALCPMGPVEDREWDAAGESGQFIGRVTAALYLDQRKLERSGRMVAPRLLAREYGVTDPDGCRPGLPDDPQAWREAYPGWRLPADPLRMSPSG